MSAAQHTPGPWDYVPGNEHHGPYITSDFGSTIADFYTMTLPNERSTANGGPSKPIPFLHEMAEPNARLAATAPELLEALEPFGDIDGEGDEDFSNDTKVTVTFGRTTVHSLTLGDFRRARAVVGKATGAA